VVEVVVEVDVLEVVDGVVEVEVVVEGVIVEAVDDMVEVEVIVEEIVVEVVCPVVEVEDCEVVVVVLVVSGVVVFKVVSLTVEGDPKNVQLQYPLRLFTIQYITGLKFCTFYKRCEQKTLKIVLILRPKITT